MIESAPSRGQGPQSKGSNDRVTAIKSLKVMFERNKPGGLPETLGVVSNPQDICLTDWFCLFTPAHRDTNYNFVVTSFGEINEYGL